MKDYGTQRSAVQPLDVEVTQTKVFVASDIQEVEVTMEEETHTEYEFNLVEYDKDEYIKMISEKNSQLESDVVNTQIALCEVYELLGS